MIVVDASVLIGHLNEADALHARAAALLEASAEQPLAASVVTLGEVLVGPTRAGTLAHAQAVLRDLDVMPIGLAQDAIIRLAHLRAESRLKLPDCCVLVAAGLVSGDVATFDHRLAAVARGQGLTVHE